MYRTPSVTRSRRLVVSAAAAVATVAVAAPSAAAAPTGIYADFAGCPTANPAVVSCLVSDTTSGAIKLGNQNVPITKTIRLQGGVTQDPETFETGFVNAANGKPTLSRTPLKVPGGLTGLITPEPSWSAPLRSLFYAAVNSVNDVTATAELVGPVGFNFGNLLNGDGVSITLPLRIKLDNPFLGDSCYVGSSGSPVTFRLTNGTTAPPAGVAPLVGDAGQLSFQEDITKLTGQSLVDNTFSAPKASGCGGVFSLIVNPIVNAKIGLPAAAGVSTARLNGDAKIAPASSVAASNN
ncbi:hypothetical protein [Patulibacter americanus]|uniref:hypothetical protein n=1 Tax=Patulibacter americanus TaxID=588672 RepID=UPI001FE18717|nr:hypothetical protein [Patulibacter americanus]